jgi:hypothetical protein
MFYEAVEVAQDFFPDSRKYQWNGMDVYAVDGSKYQLPFTNELREEFDSKCGFDIGEKGHYPQCVVTTVFDVFRKIPIARSIAPYASCERKEFMKLFHKVPVNSLLIYDRGYPSYKMIWELSNPEKPTKFLFRCPIKNTFPALDKFAQSDKTDEIIEISPPTSMKKDERALYQNNENNGVIKLRAIKVEFEGEYRVFVTNLFDNKKYTTKDIGDLYYERWTVETYYRHEKEFAEIERFHSKKENGIKQELFGICIMTLITRTIAANNTEEQNIRVKEPQFTNALLVISSDISLFNCKGEKREKYNQWMIKKIVEVVYYYEEKGRSYPRISKQPHNKWQDDRMRKIQVFENKKDSA